MAHFACPALCTHLSIVENGPLTALSQQNWILNLEEGEGLHEKGREENWNSTSKRALTHLELVLAALGAEGVGAADEEQLLGRQVRHDADVILALVLESRKCEIFLFTEKGINGDVVRRARRRVACAPERILIKVLRHSCG